MFSVVSEINVHQPKGRGGSANPKSISFFFFKKSEFALEISINVMKNEEKKMS